MAAESGESFLEIDTQGSSENSADDLVVRLRGLPYSATRSDIKDLLKDCNIVNGDKGVTFTFCEDGRPSGEAFVDLASEDDVTKALEHNNEHMGRRYVEIFRASRGEKEWDLRVSSENKPGGHGGSGGVGGENVVRLRGLPFGATENQVYDFFSGLSIVPGGVVLQKDEDGRETGIGFVEFTTKEQAEKALERDRKNMGHRYIEVFRSTQSEIKPVKSNRPTPYDRPPRHYSGYGGYGDYSSKNERTYSGGRRSGHGGGGGHYDQYHHDSYKGGSNNYYDDRGYGSSGGSGGYGSGGGGGGGGYGNSHHSQGSYNSSYQQRPPPPPRGGDNYPPSSGEAGGYVIRMRGLPYSARESDIVGFFAPQVPVKIHLEVDNYDRPSGGGSVTFATRHDAEMAMGNNKKNIGHRYIELFPQFKDDSQQHWPDPQQQGPPPVDPNYQGQQYHQPPPQSYSGGNGGSYQQSGGYQQQPATTWAGVGY